jgi:hypothetical protein
MLSILSPIWSMTEVSNPPPIIDQKFTIHTQNLQLSKSYDVPLQIKKRMVEGFGKQGGRGYAS